MTTTPDTTEMAMRSGEGKPPRPHAADTRAIRAALGLSQRKFARQYGITFATLLRWERGRSVPSAAAVTLLLLIERYPAEIAEMIAAAAV
jgi:putative transcriptional regulator